MMDKNAFSPGENQIELCSDSVSWNRYLQNHDESNFYQRYEWKSVNEENFGHRTFYLTVSDHESIRGLFPLVYIKSVLFGRIISSMPFVNFGGLCADSEEFRDSLLLKATQLTTELDADYLEIRTLKPLPDSYPASLHKISMTLDLAKDPDEIWAGFKSKHRTNIRRVYKQNIRVEQGRYELLDSFYRIMSLSWRHLGTPIYRKKYFKDILDHFGDDVKIFIAFQGEIPIATAFNGYYKDTVEGMWAGALPEYRNIHPNYALYWEMIKDACIGGYRHYHLGRSSVDSGAESFKKKWNACSKQLYFQYILNNSPEIPRLNTTNPKFQLAIKLWSRMPIALTNLIGPFVSKSIP